jgi:hydroxyethylthiazole kinase-like uncharacterized protein yjeF
VKIVTADQMRRIDAECGNIGLPASVLMENAGKGVAGEVRRILGGAEGRKVIVLAGPGNNGGDGLVAARYLNDWGAGASLYIFKPRTEEDVNYRLIRERSIACDVIEDEYGLEKLEEELAAADAVVDAIFGTGNNRPLGDFYRKALEKVSAAKAKHHGLRIIALDMPSGMNADTGVADPACLYADETVTLAFPKVGLYTPAGVERAGRITVTDIGIPADMAGDVTVELIDKSLAGSLIPERPLGANKGTFGRVMVVAGSINYIGAAYLACTAAMRVGAGLVTLATAAGIQPVLASKLTEVTYLPLPESGHGVISPQAVDVIAGEIGNYDVLLAGCGLGQSAPVARFVGSLLLDGGVKLPQMVLDADVLNILAKTPEWWRRVPDNAILTPHIGEMSRLAGVTVADVQANWTGIAVKTAREWGKTVVLKGAHTAVVTPDGLTGISRTANPGLASAGTGDVLAGAIAGLAAQGLDPAGAAACGVYLHGEAGMMVREKLGDAGMIASDLLPALPLAIKKLKASRT